MGYEQNVSVKLKSGEKVEGRIAEIKDEHFVIQLVNQGQVTAREIPYSEVKSLKGKNGSKAGKAIGYTVLGALAGIGALVLIMFAVYHDD